MPTLVTGKDLLSITPQLVIAVAAMVVLLLDAFWPRISKRLIANLTVLGLVTAGLAAWILWPKTTGTVPATMQGMILADGYSAYFTLIFVAGAAIATLLSVNYLDRERLNYGEYYALILTTTLGAVVMAASANLIGVFLGLEILSISLYIMAGYRREALVSQEAALKYFLLGAFASAFFLYGIALTYGATGSLDIRTIGQTTREAVALGADPSRNYLLLAGVAMLLVGFAFKVAVVPFHIWTPDVYEGAPTTVTAFMSVAAKAAGFAAFLRVLAVGFQDQNLQLQISAVLASIAALTMLVGNVVAVVQQNLKRLLAYSSIAHAGYILVGLVAVMRPAIGAAGATSQAQAVSAVIFYTLVYTVSNLGAFAVLVALTKKGEEVTEISDLHGLGFRYPILGVMMTLFMLSLAGMPPLAGFFGKVALAQALVSMNTPLIWLLVLFALTSVVSFYYYLGVVRAMYMEKPTEGAGEETRLSADGHLKLALALSAVGTVILGLIPGGALDLASRVATALFGVGPMAMR